MRICLFANSASIHTIRWAKYFRERSHEVTVITFESDTCLDKNIISLSSKILIGKYSYILNIYKLKKVLKLIKPEIFHAHYATSYGFFGALANYQPFIITAWGSDILVAPEKSKLLRAMIKFALNKTRAITTAGKMITEKIIERNYLYHNQIYTWPFGYDSKTFYYSPNTSLGRGINIISTRRLDDGLDVHLLIDAAEIILEKYPKATIFIAGDGVMRDNLLNKAKATPCSDRIVFLGSLSPSEMSECLNSSQYFISTSPTDGNNISLSEAMACGVYPVVAKSIANEVWIENGQNGLLFEIGCSKSLAEKVCAAISLEAEQIQSAKKMNMKMMLERGTFEQFGSLMENMYRKIIDE